MGYKYTQFGVWKRWEHCLKNLLGSYIQNSILLKIVVFSAPILFQGSNKSVHHNFRELIIVFFTKFLVLRSTIFRIWN